MKNLTQCILIVLLFGNISNAYGWFPKNTTEYNEMTVNVAKSMKQDFEERIRIKRSHNSEYNDHAIREGVEELSTLIKQISDNMDSRLDKIENNGKVFQSTTYQTNVTNVEDIRKISSKLETLLKRQQDLSNQCTFSEPERNLEWKGIAKDLEYTVTNLTAALTLINVSSGKSGCKDFGKSTDFIKASEVDDEDNLFLAGKEADGTRLYICRQFLYVNNKYDYYYGSGTRYKCLVTTDGKVFEKTTKMQFYLLRKPSNIRLEWRRNISKNSHNTAMDISQYFEGKVNGNAVLAGFNRFQKLESGKNYVGRCLTNGAYIPGVIDTNKLVLTISRSNWWSYYTDECFEYQILICKN